MVPGSVSLDGPKRDPSSYVGDASHDVEPARLTDFDAVSQYLAWAEWWARGGCLWDYPHML